MRARAILLLSFAAGFFGPDAAALSVLTYNVSGNGAADWSTNSAQVQAIGRQVAYLNPDIITFNEIPAYRAYQMTNFVNVYLPGYSLATNSGTDNFIRSVIASRFPILSSTSRLDGASLTNFGYDGKFTRDLFEAVVEVPDSPEPLHVFTAHLKAYEDADSALRRAAEASAISNLLVTVFLATNADPHYLLMGDLNEDINRPPSTSQMPIQRLVNDTTGLRLTTPTNAMDGGDRTISITAGLTKRFDYILPSPLLFSNIRTSLVYRSDLQPYSASVLTNDSATASDHLPVWMDFNFPDPPLVLSASTSNGTFRLGWPSLVGRSYAVTASTNLMSWTVAATNLTATGSSVMFTTNAADRAQFFQVYRVP